MKLQGKAAMVTGGGRGIGRAIALALAGEGADICVTARTNTEIDAVAGEIRQLGRRAIAVAGDVSDADACDKMVQQAAEELGRLDILVNNAGGNFSRGPVVESDPQTWKSVIDTNLLGTYYCCRAAVPRMIDGGGGKIINVGSGMGHSARPNNAAYNAAKAGVWMFTQCLAMEIWEHGIEVNELVPGPVYTQLTQDFFPKPGDGAPPK